ncbi:MAG: hypothetical protein NZ528_01790 [Caldilineales bacterium]|nr:hypothetical protein [Caldilineales bacterium]MDW8316312.1 hypothetical protein [Anaerolineae bacterium]
MRPQESTHLPVLRVLPVAQLLLHESSDERRVARLRQRLLEDGRLKNPPVVAPLPDSASYVVLDGANRVSAIRELGFPHIVAQVVSYDDPGVELSTWYHVVAGLPLADLMDALEAVTHLHLAPMTQAEARHRLALGDAVAYFVCHSGTYALVNTSPASSSNICILNQIVGAYKGRANIYRASNDDFSKQAPTYPDITALVVFPTYRPADIMALVRAGEVIPSGVTRHIIQERALRINIPLAVLAADQPLAEKEAWLQRWWRERLDANAIRYYAESTFLFDE